MNGQVSGDLWGGTRCLVLHLPDSQQRWLRCSASGWYISQLCLGVFWLFWTWVCVLCFRVMRLPDGSPPERVRVRVHYSVPIVMATKLQNQWGRVICVAMRNNKLKFAYKSHKFICTWNSTFTHETRQSYGWEMLRRRTRVVLYCCRRRVTNWHS